MKHKIAYVPVKQVREWNELARLKDERDELREALRKIAFDPFGSPTASHAQALDAITELSRAVLKRTEQKP